MSVTFYITNVKNEDFDQQVNFSNQNARTLLEMVGVRKEELFGEFKESELSNVLQLLILIINKEEMRAKYVSETYSEENYVQFGVTDHSIVRRATELMDLVSQAKQLGQGIYWG